MNYEDYSYIVDRWLPWEDFLEFCNRRERQILVHSYIYYRLNRNIISDDTWSLWASELEWIFKFKEECALESEFYDIFKTFDHSTGSGLDYEGAGLEWIHSKAMQLLDYEAKLGHKC